MKWPAEQIEWRRPDELAPYERNARLHSEEQVDRIARSISRFGWTMPVLIDESGVIIAGHARVMAAKKLGLDKVPVIVARGWSEEEKAAYVIADNKLTLDGEWDMDTLMAEIERIIEAGVDIDEDLFIPPEVKLDVPEIREDKAAESEEVYKFYVVVECETEQQAFELEQELADRGLKVSIK